MTEDERPTLDDLDDLADVLDAEFVEEQRPTTRRECVAGPRPCPWVACRHHLYLNVSRGGEVQFEFPAGIEPWELAATCSLDIADQGPKTLAEVGDLMNVSRERVRQIQAAVERRMVSIIANPRKSDLGLWRDELREVTRGVVQPDEDE